MSSDDLISTDGSPSPVERIIGWCLQNRMIVFLITVLLIGWGLVAAPFDWRLGGIHRDPVPVDAIPDIGENQQIVFTEWSGRSPQDVEDQITYPLSTSLLGVPGVKTIRGYSMFGFSLVYMIFEDGIDFYWSRSRVLERLNSLPARELPEGVRPTLGPDATALGQVYWYTLEGQDADGKPTGGWDLHELRSIQDWYVRYALMSVPGVSEVASVGGFVQEYQVDVDPDRMRYRDVTLEEIVNAVRRANVDVGARTIEVNRVEYVIRGLGFVKSLEDIENAFIKRVGDTPILVSHVANVALGPASRRGALDKGGAEAVGGVVVVRYGENPLAVIQRVKQKISEISLGMPSRTLPDGTVSRLAVVPFYDRTGLIIETLETLASTLSREILITIVVVLVMMRHLSAALIISGMLPIVVLLCFIPMKIFGVDANIVALSGIAIAVGTIVDMGIIITENILRHLESADPEADRIAVVLRATRDVGGAVITAVSTTIVSFLPVFTMVGAEGKLFRPLAFTKTFALTASLGVAVCIIPPLAYAVFIREKNRRIPKWVFREGVIYIGVAAAMFLDWKAGVFIALVGALDLLALRLRPEAAAWVRRCNTAVIAVGATVVLADVWQPAGITQGLARNLVFIGASIGIILLTFYVFKRFYSRILGWCLDHKALFLTLPAACLAAGGTIWLGYGTVFGWLPRLVTETPASEYLTRKFPGLGKEFMPPLDEGAFLYMPVTMPHAAIGEVMDILQRQDRAVEAVPEIKTAVGKLGRVESPLDPAPVSMIETLIEYHPEFLLDDKGVPRRFKFSPDGKDRFRSPDGKALPAGDGAPYDVRGRFLRDARHRLIPDPDGKPFRMWRPPLDPVLNPGRDAWPGILRPDDIWNEVIDAATLPGTTVAPRLQPISARIVMLQSGIRAAMGVKIYGADLAVLEGVGRRIEKFLREVPAIDPLSVIADRIVGKPYIEIAIDRRAVAQYGIDLQRVQDVIETAIGGKQITTTVEGRERYPVRVRYMRELRDHVDTIGKVLVPGPEGSWIPLVELADIRYTPGPQVIKSENTFVVGYVLFDKKPGFAETDVVEDARAHLLDKIARGELSLPKGVSFSFTGNYENQVRADRKLRMVLPLSLAIIFLILYLQFRSATTSALVFSGVAVAWSGGFIMIWLYTQPWFLDVSVFGTSFRDIFQIHPVNLSVAIWVGFLALFGIASDDGVVMATYLDQTFARAPLNTVGDIRKAAVQASLRRVRPCLITTATTILALIPVLTSTGRGSDIMIPMAIPTFGGMSLEIVTMLVVPVLYCAVEELRLKRNIRVSSVSDTLKTP